MSDLLSKAVEMFACGHYQECEDTLQLVSSQQTAFSRQRWSVECNQLTCQMKVALSGDVGVHTLSSLYTRYIALWDQMRGLPPTQTSIPTEIIVVCALHQLRLAIVAHGQVKGEEEEGVRETAYTQLIARLQALEQPESQASPTLSATSLSMHYGSASQKVMVKLTYIRAVLKLISGEQDHALEMLKAIATALHMPVEEGSGVFEAALSVGRLVHGENSELSYAQAWQQYKTGQYTEALHTVQPLLHHSSSSQPHTLAHPHITTAARLMAGACYFQLGKPNLALCSYQQCAGSHDSALAALPAMQNCAGVFRSVSKTEAEGQIRGILVKALRVREGEGGVKGDGVLWKSEGGHASLCLPSIPPGLDLPAAVYRSAMRDLYQQKYRQAASSFKEVTETLSLRPSVCPSSTLHLLLAQALMCSGEWGEGEGVCIKSIAALEPFVSSFMEGSDAREGVRPQVPSLEGMTLSLCQALWLKGMAALHLQRRAEAKQDWLRCLQLVLSLQLRLQDDCQPRSVSSAKQLQVLALNNLAVLSIGHGENSAAMQYLAEVVVVSHPHVPPPIPRYNHCLLLGKVGRMAAAAEAWVGGGGEKVTLVDGKERLVEAKRRLKSEPPGNRDHQMTAMDVAMWGLWFRARQTKVK